MNWKKPLAFAACLAAWLASGPAAARACTYQLSHTSQTWGARPDGEQVIVRTDPGCPISPVSSAPWLTISAIDLDNFSYSVSFHTASTPRTGTLTVGYAVLTVTQLGSLTYDSDHFIRRAYYEILLRRPDCPGLNAHLNMLKAGTSTRAERAHAFFESAEFYGAGRQVLAAYMGGYGLALPGFAQWRYDTERLQLGFTNVYAVAEAAAAPLAGYDNHEFVRRVYLNALLREPDAGGWAAFENALNTGAMTRGQVILNIVNSSEFASTRYAEYNTDLLYYCLLVRDPSGVGREHWVYLLATGTPLLTVIDSFLQSAEGLQRY